MSADANAPTSTDGPSVSVTDYDAMLESLDVAIEQAQDKIENGRIRDEEKEQVRIKWIRALAYTVKIRNQVAKDRDLETLAADIEDLKEGDL